ncbi:hypothetical protein HBI38_104200 [Parastagonospora nodorum]|nr:hypothetical protein HBI73_222930 [Parastagonospora nodorum]KAH5277324.1 hypothetical protein HBI72_026990 [Parastagonospora nodorum]KAH5622704.1 hypothetical protein HBI51_245390 [Parastagonospora nodorum]KAH6321152.1 hypothetical protein HBI38_104200 [Parastagonospora nodorum]KAH6391033.1 hypothetical protein HBI60_169070 [Parastagonospora nodorum]
MSTPTNTITSPFSSPPLISIPTPHLYPPFPCTPILCPSLPSTTSVPLSLSSYHASQRWMAAGAYWSVRSGRSEQDVGMVDLEEMGDYFEGCMNDVEGCTEVSDEDEREECYDDEREECYDDEGFYEDSSEEEEEEEDEQWRGLSTTAHLLEYRASPSVRVPALEAHFASGMRTLEELTMEELLAVGRSMFEKRVDSPMRGIPSPPTSFRCKAARREFDASLAFLPPPPARFLARACRGE